MVMTKVSMASSKHPVALTAHLDPTRPDGDGLVNLAISLATDLAGTRTAP